MSAGALAYISLWLTIAQWIIIAGLFFIDSLRVARRATRAHNRAKGYQNGAVIVANYRWRISRWYVLGSGLALALGLLAVYQGIYSPDPPPTFRLIGSVIREGIVVMLFAFWRTKRLNVLLQRTIDRRRFQETGRSQ